MIELSGAYGFDAPRQQVWDLLNDPDVLASCLPGCDRLEPLGDDRYRAELTVSVAAISGHYTATVAMRDKQPPESFRLVIDGTGRAGFMKGNALVQLADADSATLVSVSGQSEVGGLVARVGQRLLGSVSKMMLDRFFAALQARASGH